MKEKTKPTALHCQPPRRLSWQFHVALSIKIKDNCTILFILYIGAIQHCTIYKFVAGRLNTNMGQSMV